MAKGSKQKSYWPHMILGFLIVGITLSYWTVKSASSLPVQESNEFMMKYQQADKHINDILAQKARFDKKYKIEIEAKTVMHKIENSKAFKELRSVILKEGKNSFVYHVTDLDNRPVSDANVTFLLTRPHTTQDDLLITNIPLKGERYIVEDVNISKPGRYILQLRAQVGNAIGYSEVPAYLKPE